MCLLGVLIGLNLFSIFVYYETFIVKAYTVPEISRNQTLLLSAFILIILYFSFLSKKKYIPIYEEFEKSEYFGTKGSRITVGYILFTLFFFISLIWI